MEMIYHYIWHHRMLGRRFTTGDGAEVEVLFPGRHNNDAGPDFADARIRIDGREWIGNVEIHVKASDWRHHGHDSDPAYDNVILHVVAVDDATVSRRDGTRIPQVAVTLPEEFYKIYAGLAADIREVKCAGMISTLPAIVREDWLESLAAERIHFKASRLLEYNTLNGGDWEQSVFTLFARALGFGLNGVPFEILAKNTPLRILYHHSDNLLQLEAILFGQAGMLDGSSHIFDDYYQQLCAEYGFLARKYSLRPMNPSLWKYARTRPGNFPHRRIALLAAAIHAGARFSSGMLEARGDYDRLIRLMDWNVGGYWLEHSEFGTPADPSRHLGSLSASSRNLLIINVAAPFYMAYASMSGNFDAGELAFDLLRSMAPERNAKIRAWADCGLPAPDALRSQALLHLRDEYCDKGKCLQCRFGHHLLRSRACPAINGLTDPTLNSMRYCHAPA